MDSVAHASRNEEAKADTLVHDGARVRIGQFRARCEDPWFENSGPTQGYLVVFPRTVVKITHAGGKPIVADPSRIMFYNAGQEYLREAIAPRGDACEWFAFRAEDVADAVSAHDPSVRARSDRIDRPFTFSDGPADGRSYALQRAVLERAARGAEDPLAIEEAAFAILARAVDAAYAARLGAIRDARSAKARRAHADLADDVKKYVATRFTEALSLDRIAAAASSSPFHVCRVFRRETGLTVHAYVSTLRLAASLEPLLAGAEDLTSIALDLGYSSHAHFTTAFRAMFGIPPSELRRGVRDACALRSLEAILWRAARARS